MYWLVAAWLIAVTYTVWHYKRKFAKFNAKIKKLYEQENQEDQSQEGEADKEGNDTGRTTE